MANRVLLGNRASGGYGLYVSKPTANVLTCDVDDLTFSTLDSQSSPFSACGINQTVPFSGGTGSTAPTVLTSVSLSAGGSSTLSFNDLGDEVFAYGGFAQAATSSGSSNLVRTVKFTSTSASGTTMEAPNAAGTFVGVIFKKFGGGSAVF